MAGYTIVRLTYVRDYPVYLDLLASLNNHQELTYATLKAAYNKRKNCYSHGFIDAMIHEGNQAVEILCDFEVLQKKWAEENGITFCDVNWENDILLAQIKHIKPDVIYSDRFFAMPKALLHDRAEFPYVRVLAAQQGFPMGFTELKKADIVFSCAESIAWIFQLNGINAVHCPHSFDESIYEEIDGPGGINREAGFDFVFSGHSGYGFDWHHRTRYNYLHALLKETVLQAFITERDRSLTPHLETPLRKLFPESTHDPVYGLDMYRLLFHSKIAFNVNPDSVFGYSGIMREFEATGVGTCLLTTHTMDMGKFFEPDFEVITFNSLEECKEKLQYLLSHSDVRADIGRRARNRVLKEHLIRHRVSIIHEHLACLLRKK
ncbi:MAG: glycosyltransferase family 1 protein [Desulfamplus sp.]|nr:glycosyltransferase family 1 protein [Desulfamplus sp.]